MKTVSIYKSENKLTQINFESETLTTKLKSSLDCFEVLKKIFEREDLSLIEREHFIVLSLNNSNNIIAYHIASSGGVAGTIADGKLIFKNLLLNNASAFILCHNHPSGNKNPSEADKKLTKDLKDFGRMINLTLLDHVILTPQLNGIITYTSLADEGYI